jgi:hypothetical protein
LKQRKQNLRAVQRGKASASRLRVGDPESSRLVAVLNPKGDVVGAGCLISGDLVLTCLHVVEAACDPKKVKSGCQLRLRLCGIEPQQIVKGRFEEKARGHGVASDLAKIRLELPRALQISETEFAAPFRHGGKTFSVVGFPKGAPDGYYASGVMRGANIAGLVQLDSESEIVVQPGFSGAPVWSSNLAAYVGLIVSGLPDSTVAWCIPARVLCKFVTDLPVRFRIPPSDRPDVHDFGNDDPNIPLFGAVSEINGRRFAVTRIKKDGSNYRVDVRYECRGKPQPRGRFVTFITHPSFSDRLEDAYELFSEVKNGVADNHFWAGSSFTIAAIGDGGDTALTYDIAKFPGRPKGMK